VNQPNQNASAEVSPAEVIRQMIQGLWISRILYIAAELGLADLLKDGPKGSQELALSTGTDASALYRVMRALTSVGIFTEDDQQRFALNPLGATLQSDALGALRASVINALGHERYQAWSELMYTVQTGGIAFDHVFGMGAWQYRAEHPNRGSAFNQAMSNLTGRVNAAVLAAYPFSNFNKIVDVGGGDGSLMISILQKNSTLTGVVIDLPHVAEKAKVRIAEAGLADRCEIIGGDIFQMVPSGGDAYILSRVIHDWDDERAIALLQSCSRAMPLRTKLLLIERSLPGRLDQSAISRMVVMSDLTMMVMNGGRERTASEYRAVLEAAGFRLAIVVPTESVMCVIEGERMY
jgi:hypothetical protein